MLFYYFYSKEFSDDDVPVFVHVIIALGLNTLGTTSQLDFAGCRYVVMSVKLSLALSARSIGSLMRLYSRNRGMAQLLSYEYSLCS